MPVKKSGSTALPRPKIKIENNIPIPVHSGAGQVNPETADIYEAVGDLEPGQSFVIATERFHQGMPSNFVRKFGGKFTRRQYRTGPETGKTRIWRIE